MRSQVEVSRLKVGMWIAGLSATLALSMLTLLADPPAFSATENEEGGAVNGPGGSGFAAYEDAEGKMFVEAQDTVQVFQGGTLDSGSADAEDTVATTASISNCATPAFKVFISGSAQTWASATYVGTPTWDWSAITGVGPDLSIILNKDQDDEQVDGWQDSVGVVMYNPQTFQEDSDTWNYSDVWSGNDLETADLDFDLYGYLTIHTREPEGTLFSRVETTDTGFSGHMEGWDYSVSPPVKLDEHFFALGADD